MKAKIETMIQEYGFAKTAQAVQALYNNDALTLTKAQSAMRMLRARYARRDLDRDERFLRMMFFMRLH